MDSTPNDKVYKSPIKKLVRFFEKSRDQWKVKCREAKAKVKRLTNRTRFLEKSKAKLKGQVKELEAEVIRLRASEQTLRKEVEELQKRGRTSRTD